MGSADPGAEGSLHTAIRLSCYVRVTFHARAADLAPAIQDIRATGAQSLRAIARELSARGITAPRGGEWSAPEDNVSSKGVVRQPRKPAVLG
jgi:hypothetical protein